MSLLEEAIEAHGGRRRWGKVGEISARVRSGGPTSRRVVPKGITGCPLRGPTVVWIELDSIGLG